MQTELVVSFYEFDGTKEGVNLLNERLYSNDKDNYKACILTNGEIKLKSGLLLRKGDVYQVRQHESFEAIG